MCPPYPAVHAGLTCPQRSVQTRGCSCIFCAPGRPGGWGSLAQGPAAGMGWGPSLMAGPTEVSPRPRRHPESGPPAHSDAICREGFEASWAVAGDMAGGCLLLESVSLLHTVPVDTRQLRGLGLVVPQPQFLQMQREWCLLGRGPEGSALGDRHIGPVQHPAGSVDSGLRPVGEQICLLVSRSRADVPEETRRSRPHFLVHFIWQVSSNSVLGFISKG